MTDLLSMSFMQNALAAAVMVSMLCAVISVFVVLKRLSFIGVGISHSAFGGVSLGVLLGVNPALTAIAFSLSAAMAIGQVSRNSEIHEDTAIGILFAATMALGILLLSLSRSYTADLFGFLFGNILAVTRLDLLVIAILSACVLSLVRLFFKELLFICFDEEMAQVSGLPVAFLYFLLLGLMAVTVVVSIKIVGIILVSALLVIPGAAAYRLTFDYKRMLYISVAVGLVSSLVGLWASYYLDIPSGATIVLTATVIFLLCYFFTPKK
jgi:ABC-type Mn2+/Zn2+ transport system permease subunit